MMQCLNCSLSLVDNVDSISQNLDNAIDYSDISDNKHKLEHYGVRVWCSAGFQTT